MSSKILGLGYERSIDEITTEAKALELFSDLKKVYSNLNENFKMYKGTNKAPITSLSDFLTFSVGDSIDLSDLVSFKPIVNLKGSGEIAGLVLKDVSIDYDLSEAYDVFKYWDIRIVPNCHNCHNHYYASMDGGDTEHACTKLPFTIWKNCDFVRIYMRLSYRLFFLIDS